MSKGELGGYGFLVEVKSPRRSVLFLASAPGASRTRMGSARVSCRTGQPALEPELVPFPSTRSDR